MSKAPETNDHPFFLEANFADAEKRLLEFLRKLPPSDEADLRVKDLQTLVYETVPELSGVARKIAHSFVRVSRPSLFKNCLFPALG